MQDIPSHPTASLGHRAAEPRHRGAPRAAIHREWLSVNGAGHDALRHTIFIAHKHHASRTGPELLQQLHPTEGFEQKFCRPSMRTQRVLGLNARRQHMLSKVGDAISRKSVLHS